MNFISAVEQHIVRDSVARDLLEAQAACGTILNVETGYVLDSLRLTKFIVRKPLHTIEECIDQKVVPTDMELSGIDV